MYSLYYLDNVLVITGNIKEKAGYELFFAKDKQELCSFVQNWIDGADRRDTMIYGYDLEKMFHHLKKYFKYVEAAGGVVRNAENKLMFIRRWDKWDLPKGKVDKGESVKPCALREVAEETGVKGLKISGTFPSSFHFYYYKEKLFLKKTYWFLMDTQYNGPLKPQVEEDITQVEWLDTAQCRDAFRQTYRSLSDNLEASVCKVFENAG